MIRLLSLLALAHIMSAMAQAQQRNVLLIIAEMRKVTYLKYFNFLQSYFGLGQCVVASSISVHC